MQSTNDIGLRSFYIFNSKYGPNEGEEANKILFYHPAEIGIDTQKNDMGLTEALIQFTKPFADEAKPKCLHTQKTSQLIYQPEPGFWMVMTLNVPYEEKSKGNSQYKEYRGDDVHDKIYQAIVEQCYHSFRLFHDTFAANAVGDSLIEQMTAIRKKLKFYTHHLTTLELKSADILDVFNSVHYFALTQQRFLRLQIFINMIESAFTAIKHCVFLYDEQIVWSGINPTDLFSLNEYLVGTLFPSKRASEGRSANVRLSDKPKFLTGPLAEGGPKQMPKVYIHNSGEPRAVYNLAVYRARASTICLFIEDSDLQLDVFNEIHAFIGPQLVTLTAEIEMDHKLPTAPDKSPEPVSKYLYFNELNRLHSSTVHVRNTLSETIKHNSTISRELTNLIADLYEERRPGKPNLCEETYLKTHNDYWLVRRTSNYRHFFIVLNKNCTLLETQDEMQRSIAANVQNVFF